MDYESITEQVEAEEMRWDEDERRYVSTTTATVWGEARNCRQCARQQLHTYADHCRAVAVSRIERMED